MSKKKIKKQCGIMHCMVYIYRPFCCDKDCLEFHRKKENKEKEKIKKEKLKKKKEKKKQKEKKKKKEKKKQKEKKKKKSTFLFTRKRRKRKKSLIRFFWKLGIDLIKNCSKEDYKRGRKIVQM